MADQDKGQKKWEEKITEEIKNYRRAAALAAHVDKKRREGYEVLVRRGKNVYRIRIS